MKTFCENGITWFNVRQEKIPIKNLKTFLIKTELWFMEMSQFNKQTKTKKGHKNIPHESFEMINMI